MKNFIRLSLLTVTAITCGSCANSIDVNSRVIPAQEFARAVEEGNEKSFTIFDAVDRGARGQLVNANLQAPAVQPSPSPAMMTPGDPRYLNAGYQLAKSYSEPASIGPEQLAKMPLPPGPPPGSSAPYLSGQMTANPSLWPDEAQGASLFRDHRAFQAMDIITIMIAESSIGRRKADTKAEGKLTLKAALSSFFGLEKTALDNKDIDPASLINASTENKWDGKAETKREGELRARMSAVILDVLPNGLLRIEGTKIISVNSEEEIMVVSGLARARDIDAGNRIESDRIANMRIDFYGRGVVSDKQSPGWGVRLFDMVWPF